MNTYTITTYLITRKGREIIEIVEFERARWTSREYKEILLPNLTWLAGRGIEYCWLDAEIRRNGELILDVRCDTRMHGSTITATIAAARPRERYRRLRTMTLAE